MLSTLKNKFGDLRIKFKIILGIVIILIIAMTTLSVVFIVRAQDSLVEALRDKAALLNKNFSIVSAKAIEESSYTNLQSLIDEVAKDDKEIKLMIVTDSEGSIIATSDQKKYKQFGIFNKESVKPILKKKDKDHVLEDWSNSLFESVGFIFAKPVEFGEDFGEGDEGADLPEEGTDPDAAPEEKPENKEVIKEETREETADADTASNTTEVAAKDAAADTTASVEADQTTQDVAVSSQTGEKRGEYLGFIYIALSTENLEDSIRSTIIYSLMIASVLMGIGIFLAYWFGITMAKPIGILAEEVQVIASGNLEKAIQSESKDEIGQLVSDVDKMRLSIKDLTDNLEAKVEERTEQLQEANDKIQDAMDALWGEMELAKKIQTVLLPSKPELSGYDISASLEAADEVGGDYYDVITVDGFDWIIIGDVSGHGVPAGLIMMMAQTAIHTVLAENPQMASAQLMTVVNKTIAANIARLGESKYMTMTVLAGMKDGAFSFSGLHQDILVYRAATNKADAIETQGMWLGLEPDISTMLEIDNLKLEIGDTMLLYTDGVTEAMDKKGDMFGEEHLFDLVEKHGKKSAAEVHKAILDELDPYEKPDDVTLVIIKRLK